MCLCGRRCTRDGMRLSEEYGIQLPNRRPLALLSRSPLGRQIPISRSPLGRQIPVSRSPLGRQIPISRSPLGRQIPVSRSPLGRQIPRNLLKPCFLNSWPYQVKEIYVRFNAQPLSDEEGDANNLEEEAAYFSIKYLTSSNLIWDRHLDAY
ncbi:uncharacterized protein LOC125474797 [Pyrus x bretschneideri]|uniref:uncharacterized protein LOC125474797 n=1 Tax=Pyrus x bretschneideri TaxID=225117 RepID=UPI00202F2464|nr:uncharacterized protein LOC125474797 [Pyrus x bretschneideri]